MHWWRWDVNVQNPSASRRVSGNVRTGVIIAPKTGGDFANFSNQRGVRQSSLFLGKHRRSSINQEDQNVVLNILGENTCYFFPLGWQMLNSTFVSGANETISMGLCWPRRRVMATAATASGRRQRRRKGHNTNHVEMSILRGQGAPYKDRLGKTWKILSDWKYH